MKFGVIDRGFDHIPEWKAFRSQAGKSFIRLEDILNQCGIVHDFVLIRLCEGPIQISLYCFIQLMAE